MDNTIVVCLYAEQQLNYVTVLIVSLVCLLCLSFISLVAPLSRLIMAHELKCIPIRILVDKKNSNFRIDLI